MAVATLRRPLHERFLSVILTVISLLFVAIPVSIWWHMHTAPKDVARQQSVSIPALPPRDLALYHRVAAASAPSVPVALAYHDIRPGADADNDPYTVTPEEFAGQMKMLKESGFHSLTATQIHDWLRGADLPRRSVAVTFDDGPSGLWRYADPVLARLDMHAIAFVITGSVGHHRPYYLSWNELQRMQHSGRWDIESHTRDGHGLVQSGAKSSKRGPFLINRAWLPKQHRLETIDEYEERVRRDLAGSINDIVAHDLRRPRLFAFPFSAETSPTNDTRAPEFVSDLVRKKFGAAVTNTEPASWVTQRDRDRRVLPRVEVFAGMKPRAVFNRIRAAAPLGLAAREPLKLPGFWVDSAGLPFSGKARRGLTTPMSGHRREVTFAGGAMTMKPRSNAWLGAFFAPGQMADWRNYALSAHASGLSGGGSAGLLLHTGDPTGVISVGVSQGYVSVHAGNGDNDHEIGNAHIPQADAHQITVKVNGSALSVTIDGTQVLSFQALKATSSGGIGLSANPGSGSGTIKFTDVVVQPIATTSRQ